MTSREKRLLGGCIAVIFTSAATIVAKEYMDRSAAVEQRIGRLEGEKQEAEAWIKDRAFQEKRAKWLDEHLPKAESTSHAQGELWEDMQSSVLDQGFTFVRAMQPIESTKTDHYQEVAVSMNVRGDQSKVMAWLATMQSPEYFQIIKSLEIEPDGKAKEKVPYCFANLTVSRWFKPE